MKRSVLFVSVGLMLLSPGRAPGHLSIIRQGPESRGAREAGDRYGAAVAAGDFNGDGYADLAGGAPRENIESPAGDIVDAGAVIISYGSWTGLTHAGADILTQGSLGYTDEANDNFGASLIVGNFDGDAYDDLAIGSPGESINGLDNAGNVIIVYGSATGLGGSSTIVSQGNSAGALEANDSFGYSLTVGDFNGDGRDDLAVGIPGEDVLSGSVNLVDAGAVEFYFGSATGITTAGSYIITDDDTTNPAEANAAYGFALASGNFDGDQYDDIVIGTPGKDLGGPANVGTVDILYGTNTGISPVLIQFFSQVSLGGTSETGDQFGYALAAGDTNGDGYDDIAIAAPFKNNGNVTDGGRAYVAYGTFLGLATATATILNPVNGPGSAVGDQFGFALAMGDWTGDGRDELAVGVPFRNTSDVANLAVSDAGIVAIYNGSATGIVSSNPTIRDQEILNEVSEPSDQIGMALAFGDFAADDREGLAVGAPLENFEPAPGITATPATDAGAVYIDMPWRQAQSLSCRMSVLVDCDGQIVFSQKPFDQNYLASTSKIMTALLAIEATQPDCNPCTSLNSVYTFPQVFDEPSLGGTLGGSLAGLCQGETMTLGSLLYAMLFPSGNDAAFSIADHIVNPGANCAAAGCADVLAFADMMNARAAELGMTDTVFENPSGGGHAGWASANRSTPVDMVRLANAAMQNPLYYQYSTTGQITIPRINASCLPANTMTTYNTGVFFLDDGVGFDFPGGSGLKPGSTPTARRTFVASAEHSEGRYFAVALGSVTTATPTCAEFPGFVPSSCDVLKLLDLGRTEFCVLDDLALPPPGPGTSTCVPNQSSQVDYGHTLHLPIDPRTDRTTSFRATLSPGTTTAHALVRLKGAAQLEFAPGQQMSHTIAPFRAHTGIVLTNIGSSSGSFIFTTSHPSQTFNVTLAPGQSSTIPPYTAPLALGTWVFDITYTSSTSTGYLEVRLNGYESNVVMTLAAPSFTQTIGWGNSVIVDGLIEAQVIGQDANPGPALDLCLVATLDADGDLDGDFDLRDFANLQNCFGSPSDDCIVWDFDEGGSVGLPDYDAFESLFTGPQ
jgi:D-alanyl-D-alanine carboxypeptidase